MVRKKVVSDSQPATVTDGLTTTVNFALEASGSGTVSVDSVTYSASGGRTHDKHITITIAIVDDTGAAVSGATVSADVDKDLSFFDSFSGTTDGGGEVSFTISNGPSGTYVTTVTDVVASGLVFDGVTPPNSFTK